MSIDPKFVELTADVVRIYLLTNVIAYRVALEKIRNRI